ncbi:MAG: 30S ribosomal protein S2 [Candidatus Micrarchaeota archaeon]
MKLKEENNANEEIAAEAKAPELKTLIPLEKYLEAGVHIGSKYRSGDMRKFIYKCRNDGLCVLDIAMLNSRIITASKFISRYEPSEVLVVAARNYAQKPSKMFAEAIGAMSVIGRFVPGTLTNPGNDNFLEPKLIVTADPPADRQAIKEAVTAKIPVLSLCDTSNLTKNIDYIIPINNKGKKSLALTYWLLARECLKIRGVIEKDSQFDKTTEDFESKAERRSLTEDEKLAMEKQAEERGKRWERDNRSGGDRGDRRGGGRGRGR